MEWRKRESNREERDDCGIVAYQLSLKLPVALNLPFEQCSFRAGAATLLHHPLLVLVRCLF